MSGEFEVSYPIFKRMISDGRYRSVLYNLDQCENSWVERNTILDVLRSTASIEIFYTFAIKSLLTFLSKTNPQLLASQLQPLGVDIKDLGSIEEEMSNRSWLGAAERLVFESYKGCASFVSPFSINNPNGWLYWLMHFSNNYRARQVYNNTLHDNSNCQAHYGRSGLDMLAYDQAHEDGALYLFDLRRAVMQKSIAQ